MDVAFFTECLVSQKVNMLPCHQRYFLEHCQRLDIDFGLIPIQQRRGFCRVSGQAALESVLSDFTEKA